ncbi:MAG: ABC transporter permease [Actinobacteria bacterium]|nr:ABC transporter permease [Actinomycetota bacterium]
MGRYVIRRVLQFIPVFIGATFLIFAMVFAIPGDPIRALSGERPMPPNTRQALQERYNTNDALMVQYGKYIGVLDDEQDGYSGIIQCVTFSKFGTCDFGEDFRGRPVTAYFQERIPITAKLALGAFVFETILGLVAGVLAGLRKGGFVDNLVLVSTTAVISIPIFVLGFIAQLVLGVRFQIFPVAGVRQGLQSYILPSMVLGSVSLAFIARLTRTSLVENLRSDYVRTATAKGLRRRRVVGLHALRNSLIPVITFIGVDLGALMGGAIITETIFNIPGLGRAVFEAVGRQEGTVVVGITTFLVLIFMVSNLVVDVLYAVLDPRIRYE